MVDTTKLCARNDAVGRVLSENGCECPEGKHGDDSDDIATRGRRFIERLEAGQIPLRDGTDVTKALATAASLLRSCCGALESAERRAEEAEAQAAAWRQHVAALVAAMKTWGSLEDGVPSADDVGEIGDIGRAFDAAHNALRVKLSETTALHGIAEARERLLERELLDRLRAAESERDALRARADAVGRVLSENGCDCDCGCFWDEHGDGCDRCLACRVEDAIARREDVVRGSEP